MVKATCSYGVFSRPLAGGAYQHIFTGQDSGYAVDWATRYAFEAKPGIVFGVYAQPAGTEPPQTSMEPPAGTLVFEVISRGTDAPAGKRFLMERR